MKNIIFILLLLFSIKISAQERIIHINISQNDEILYDHNLSNGIYKLLIYHNNNYISKSILIFK